MDPRVHHMAELLVEYSARIGKGDRILLQAEPAAEPLLRALFEEVLKRGGHPYLFLNMSGQISGTGFDEVFFRHAGPEQLDHTPVLLQYAYEHFESRIRIDSVSNVKSLANVDPNSIGRRRMATGPILQTQFDRGDRGEFRWVSTLFPTAAYAQAADMSLSEYEDFVFTACHVNQSTADAIAHWEKVQRDQQKYVESFSGHDQVQFRSPHCDFRFSIKDRTFISASGYRNMPDGEIYTGPVEDSVNGWIHFPNPVTSRGTEVEGLKLTFEDGRAVHAEAEKNQEYLQQTLSTDDRSCYLGEVGIGTNYDISRFTHDILFDEKIGGTFHIAFGSGYPVTGSQNKSAIHWDMICDFKTDSEILLDGEVVYRDGHFLI
jgi:aminopeptidase